MLLPQLLFNNLKDLRWRNVFHTLGCIKPAICRVFCIVARAAPDTALQDGSGWADRAGMGRIGRAMYSDQRRSDRRRDMHGAAISTDEQVSALQQRCQLLQAGFSGQVDRLLLHAAGYTLYQREVIGRARQHDLYPLLAYKTIKQRGPVRNGPAF